MITSKKTVNFDANYERARACSRFLEYEWIPLVVVLMYHILFGRKLLQNVNEITMELSLFAIFWKMMT